MFTFSPTLHSLSLPPSHLLSAQPIHHLMTSTIVFSPSTSDAPSPPRILLLRRSPADSHPLTWEPPGGSIGTTDPSVLAAAARELLEETSLAVSHFSSSVGRLLDDGDDEVDAGDQEIRINKDISMLVFHETNSAWGKITLVASVHHDPVRINPEEHVEWAWVSEDEVRSGLHNGRVLHFISPSVRSLVLQAFRSRGEPESIR